MKDKQPDIERQSLQLPEGYEGENRSPEEAVMADATTIAALGAEAIAVQADPEPIPTSQTQPQAKRRQGAPIIAQSPTFVARGVKFTVLPSGVATIPGSPLTDTSPRKVKKTKGSTKKRK